jgi:ParB/RepB/Spo0J family partition protein
MQQQLVLPIPIDPARIADKATKRKLAIRVDGTVKILLEKCVVREHHNGRKKFGDIPEFSKSLIAYGQLIEIAGDLLDDGTFIVTYGERRVLAMKYARFELGLDKFEYVLAKVNRKDITEAERIIMAVVENSHRKNYEPLEEANEYWKMLQIDNPLTGKPFNQTEIAEACGVSKMHVSNRLRLFDISDEEKEAIEDGTISPTALGGMIKQGLNEDERKEMINKSKETGEKIQVKDVLPIAEEPAHSEDKFDSFFEDSARLIVMHQQGSTSLLQRKLKLGYNRAGRIIDQLEAAGIVGPFLGTAPREVLIPDEYALEAKFVEIGLWKDDEYTKESTAADPDEVMGDDENKEADHQDMQDQEISGVNKKVREVNVYVLASEAILMLGGVDHMLRKDQVDVVGALAQLGILKDTIVQLQKIGKAIKERD